jgi:hypothetical protein
MPTMLVVHEVEDVEHWLRSPTREEVFGPLGFTTRTFVDPTNAHRVGLIVDGPDLGTFDEFMKTDAAADAMKRDGVRPETLQVFVEP